MIKQDKELIVVGDRVLVRVEEGEERTNVGLYLPPTAIDNQAVQGGKIVATGPGLPMPSPDSFSDEPWQRPSARRGSSRCRHATATTRSFSERPRSRSPSRATDISWSRRPRSSHSSATSSESKTPDIQSREFMTMRLPQQMYDERLVTPMRQDLTRLGVQGASHAGRSGSRARRREGHDAGRRELGVRLLGAHGAAGGRDRAAESDQAGQARRRCSPGRTPTRRRARGAISPGIRRRRRRSAC